MFCSFLTTTLLLTACASNLDSFERYRKAGYVAQQKGDLAGAEKEYKMALECARQYSDEGQSAKAAYFDLAHVLFLQKRDAEAEPLYKKVTELETERIESLGPSDLEVLKSYLEMATGYARRSDRQHADAAYKSALIRSRNFGLSTQTQVVKEYAGYLRATDRAAAAVDLEKRNAPESAYLGIEGVDFTSAMSEDTKFARLTVNALTLLRKEQYPQAMDGFKQALKEASISNPDVIHSAIKEFAYVYEGKLRFVDEKELLLYGLSLEEKLPPHPLAALTMTNLARVSKLTGDPAREKTWLFRALDYQEKYHFNRLFPRTCLYLADVFKENAKTYLMYVKKALAATEIEKNTDARIESLVALGDVYRKENKKQMALKYYTEADALARTDLEPESENYLLGKKGLGKLSANAK